MKRRDFLLATGSVFASASTLGMPYYIRQAESKEVRNLSINIVSNTLGIQVPYVATLNDILPKTPGYGTVKWARMSGQETLAQAVLTGSVEIAGTDPITAVRAVEAGGDLRIIGNQYFNTPNVLVVNAERIKEDADMERSDVTWATNALRDQMYVAFARPLEARGVDLSKTNALAISGSSNRLRALLSDRLDAAPLHIDQAWEVTADPKYRIMVWPSEAYPHYLTEVWMASANWLEDPANQRAAVDLMKAQIIGLRNAHDQIWYRNAYRSYCTAPEASKASDEYIDRLQSEMINKVKAWPKDMMHRLEVYEELFPYYIKYGAIKGSIKPEQVVDTRFSDQALEELDKA